MPAEQIDPMWMEKSYYLEPEKSGAKPYALLREALREADRMALVTISIRQRSTMAVLRVRDDVIVLQTLLWPDEIRQPDFGSAGRRRARPGPQELAMAASLVESLSGDYDPDEFNDEYRDEMERLVDSKLSGGDGPGAPAAGGRGGRRGRRPAVGPSAQRRAGPRGARARSRRPRPRPRRRPPRPRRRAPRARRRRPRPRRRRRRRPQPRRRLQPRRPRPRRRPASPPRPWACVSTRTGVLRRCGADRLLRPAGGEDDVQAARAVDALDPLELDVAGRARPADEGQRAGRVEPGQAFGHACRRPARRGRRRRAGPGPA